MGWRGMGASALRGWLFGGTCQRWQYLSHSGRWRAKPALDIGETLAYINEVHRNIISARIVLSVKLVNFGVKLVKPRVMSGEPGVLRIESGVKPRVLRIESGVKPRVLRIKSGVMSVKPRVLRIEPGVKPRVLRIEPGVLRIEPDVMSVKPGVLRIESGVKPRVLRFKFGINIPVDFFAFVV